MDRNKRLALAHGRLWWFYFNGEYLPKYSDKLMRKMQDVYRLCGGQVTFDQMYESGELSLIFVTGHA